MADAVRGFSALEQELQKTRESLKDVDENIKKLIGRDPAEQRPGPQRRAAEPRGRERIFNTARRGTLEEDGPQARRRGAIGDPFSRLGSRLGPRPTRGEGRRGADSGEDEDLEEKPTISSVVSTPKETRTRQTSIEEQNKDVSGKARNKRMFGVLIGTLQRFKTEAVEAKEKEERRKEIEKKLDEKFKQEKEEIIRERRLLFQERRQKQWKIRLLEQKMELAQNHESWEQETRKLACFIRTKAKPHIFYFPTSMNPELISKLKSTEKIIEEMIMERRRKLEEEIEELMVGSQKEGEGEEEEEYMEEEQEEVEEEADEDHEEGEIIERKRVKMGGEEKENMRENSSRSNKSKSESSSKEIRKSSRERESNISSREHDQKHNKPDKGKKRSSREREHRRSSRDREGRHSSRGRERKSSHSREGDRDGDREKRRSSGDKEKRRSSGDIERRERRRSGRDETKENKKMRSISGKVSKDEEDYDKEHFASKSKKFKAGGDKYEKKEKVWAPMEDEEEEEMDAGGGGGTEKKAGGEGVASEEGIVQEKESERAEERTSVPDSQQLAMGLEHEEMDYEN